MATFHWAQRYPSSLMIFTSSFHIRTAVTVRKLPNTTLIRPMCVRRTFHVGFPKLTSYWRDACSQKNRSTSMSATMFPLWFIPVNSNKAAMEPSALPYNNDVHATGSQSTLDGSSNVFENTAQSMDSSMVNNIINEPTLAQIASDNAADVAASATTSTWVTEIGPFGMKVAKPVEFLLTSVHQYTGMPWWGTIVAVTIFIRFALAPIAALGIRNGKRMALIKPDMDYLRDQLMDNIRRNPSQVVSLRKKFSMDVQALHKAGGIRMSIILFQVGGMISSTFVFLSMFFAVRKLAQFDVDFKTGGLGMFMDLTAVDPTYLLPIVTAATQLLSMYFMRSDTAIRTALQKKMEIVFSIMIVAFIPFMGQMPVGLFYYWLTTNLFSCAQSLAFRTLLLNEYSAYLIPCFQVPVHSMQYNQSIRKIFYRGSNTHHTKRSKYKPSKLLSFAVLICFVSI